MSLEKTTQDLTLQSMRIHGSIMHGSILPVTIPPGHTPGDLQFFSHLAPYSPPPGMQKETIPQPRDSSSTTNMLFCEHAKHRLRY